MTAQHTAGPWRYDPEWALIVGPNDEEIAACHAAQEYEEKRHKRNRAAFRASEHHHHEHPENMSTTAPHIERLRANQQDSKVALIAIDNNGLHYLAQKHGSVAPSAILRDLEGAQ